MDIAQKLNTIYFNPANPASFGSAYQLARATGEKLADVKKWLIKQNAYTLHTPVRRKFQRRKVIVGGIDHQWQADLIDVSSLKNKGVKFILTVVDVLSRYGWARPLPDKSNKSMVKAFRDIIVKSGRKPFKLQSDDGTEFKGRVFKSMLSSFNIDWFSTKNMDTKATIVERFNRTLMSKLSKVMTHTGKGNVVKLLPSLLEAYNSRVHSSTGYPPEKVTHHNAETVWHRLYEEDRGSEIMLKNSLSSHHLLNVKDAVRLAKFRKTFSKGYRQGWTDEVFHIATVMITRPTTYKVADFNGDLIEGTFYRRELQHVDPEIYYIEKIMRTRKKGKTTEHLIKWKGYPASANSWITKSMLIELQ